LLYWWQERGKASGRMNISLASPLLRKAIKFSLSAAQFRVALEQALYGLEDYEVGTLWGLSVLFQTPLKTLIINYLAKILQPRNQGVSGLHGVSLLDINVLSSYNMKI
jgi:hypothetical protein